MYNYKEKQRELTKQELELISKYFMNEYHDVLINVDETKYETYEEIVIDIATKAFTVAFDLPECGGTLILLLEGFEMGLEDGVVDKNVEHLLIKNGVVEAVTDHDFIEQK
jgi:hypothetical protein